MATNINLYIIFAGTTDYIDKLKLFLSAQIPGWSLFEGIANWNYNQLNSQLLIFYNRNDAIVCKDFLINHCNQKEVDILRIDAWKQI